MNANETKVQTWQSYLTIGIMILTGIMLSIGNRYWSDHNASYLVYATVLGQFVLALLPVLIFQGTRLIVLVLLATLLVPIFVVHPSLPAVRMEQLIIFYYVVQQFLQRKTGREYKAIRFWFILIALSMIISALYAAVFLQVPPAYQDSFEVVKLISYYFFFRMAYNELPSTRSLRPVLNTFIGIMIAGNLFSFAQYFNLFGINWWLTIFYAAKTQFEPVVNYAHRILGLLPNPNDFGMLNVLFLTLILVIFFRRRHSMGMTVFYLAVLALAYRVTFMTLSRSAMVTALLTFIATLIWLRNRGLGKVLWWKALGVVLIAVTMYISLPPVSQERMTSALNIKEDTSIQGRLGQYQRSTGSISESPILGWGPAKGSMENVLDSDFLLLIRRYGLLGLSLYLLLYWKVFSHARIGRTDNDEVTDIRLFLTVGMVGLMAFNLPAGTVNNMQFLNWYWLMVGVYFAGERLALKDQIDKNAGKKNILMLLSNPYTNDPRVQIEAKTLIGQGHKVSVLAWDRSGDYKSQETMEGVEVIRIFKPSETGSGIKQLPTMLKYWFSAWWYATRHHDYDVVHAHDFDTVPLGYALANDRYTPFFYDAHESYVDMVGGRFPAWVKECVVRAENYYLRRASAVITVGHILKEELKHRGARNCLLIGNWKDLEEFQISGSALEEKRESLDLKGKLVISYLGGMAKVRNVIPLIEAVAQRPQVVLLLAGPGETAVNAAEAAKIYPNIHYFGQLPAQEIPLYTALSDVIYYGIDPTYPNAKYSAPNKLYEAMAAGKALLVTRAGEVGPTVEQEKAGIILESSVDLPSQIKEALDKLSDPELLAQYKENSRRAGQEKYNWQAGASTLIGLYEEGGASV